MRLYEDIDNAVISSMLARGAGIISPPNYPGADILIPVRYLKNMQPSIGCVLIQVKNRAYAAIDDSLRDGARVDWEQAALKLEHTRCFNIIMALQEKRGAQLYDVLANADVKGSRRSKRKPQHLTVITAGFGQKLFPNISGIGKGRDEIYQLLDKHLKWHQKPDYENDEKMKQTYLRNLIEY